nr:hypothetical protein BaRGS_001183 [Batillaria attramentaria]
MMMMMRAGKHSEAPYLVDPIQIKNRRAAEGGRVKFRCKVSGKPRPYLLWYRNNDLINHIEERISITKYGLQIDKVNQNDSGKYSCRAENKHGELWVNFTLDVESLISCADCLEPF